MSPGGAAPTLWSRLERDPADPAVADSRRADDWAELETRTAAIGHGVEALGLGPGDHVALVAGNRVEFYEVLIGVQRAGMTVSPLKAGWTAAEIGYVLADAGTRLVVTDADAARGAAVAAGLAVLDLEAGFEDWLAVQDQSPLPADRVGRRMSYTSGTTGRPKGVVRHLAEAPCIESFARGRLMAQLLGLPGAGVHLMVAALFHGAPLAFSLNALAAGQSIRILERWDAAAGLQALGEGVASTTMVPTQFRQLLALPVELRAAFSPAGLRRVLHGGEPCPVEVKRRMVEWWGPLFTEYYGASEGGMSLATTEEWLARPGTVGRAIPGQHFLILDDQGRPLPPRTEGRVHVVTPGADRGFSYLNDTEKTERAHSSGAFTVGDIGWLDEDGYLFISGRQADAIVSAGVNIYPAEVEAVLATIDDIVDACVIGGPHEERGETVVALLVLRDGADQARVRAEVDARCAAALAAYQRPREVKVRESLPRDATGKLLRRTLRAELWGDRSHFAAPHPG